MESPQMRRKKICVVVANRADYGRLRPVMRKIRAHPLLELQVIAATSSFLRHFFWHIRHGKPTSLLRSLPWYIRARLTMLFGTTAEKNQLDYITRLISNDGFSIDAHLPFSVEGGDLVRMAKSAGACLWGLPSIFGKLKPDGVLVNGDRFEILSVAIAAAYLNIPLIHLEGGDVSGTIDESIRHAVTKLAHLHFPATEKSKARILAMGEDPERVFCVGSPAIDELTHQDMRIDNSVYERNWRKQAEVDFTKPYILVVQHPVTTRYEENFRDMQELVAALSKIPLQKVFLASNIDAGSDGVSRVLRELRDRTKPARCVFFKSFTPQDFHRVLANAVVAVGNSSAFIREAAYLGVPVVLVGDRQQGRERAGNVVEVACNEKDIRAAIEKQIAHGKYSRDIVFGDGHASEKIAHILASFPFERMSVQKRFFESYNLS